MESNKNALHIDTDLDFLEEELNIFEKTFEELSGLKMNFRNFNSKWYFSEKNLIKQTLEPEPEKKDITENTTIVDMKEKPKLLPKPKLYPKPSNVKVGIK